MNVILKKVEAAPDNTAASKNAMSRGRSDTALSAANMLALRRRCMAAVAKLPKFALLPPTAVELVVAAATRRTAAAGQEVMQQVSATKPRNI